MGKLQPIVDGTALSMTSDSTEIKYSRGVGRDSGNRRSTAEHDEFSEGCPRASLFRGGEEEGKASPH